MYDIVIQNAYGATRYALDCPECDTKIALVMDECVICEHELPDKMVIDFNEMVAYK